MVTFFDLTEGGVLDLAHLNLQAPQAPQDPVAPVSLSSLPDTPAPSSMPPLELPSNTHTADPETIQRVAHFRQPIMPSQT